MKGVEGKSVGDVVGVLQVSLARDEEGANEVKTHFLRCGNLRTRSALQLTQAATASTRTPFATTFSLSTHLLFSASPSPLSSFPSVRPNSSTSIILALSSTLPPPLPTPPVPLITARNNATAPASYRSYAIRFAVYCGELEEDGRLAREGWRARAERWRIVARVRKRRGRGRGRRVDGSGPATRARLGGLGFKEGGVWVGRSECMEVLVMGGRKALGRRGFVSVASRCMLLGGGGGRG